jgi:hypothetical protein
MVSQNANGIGNHKCKKIAFCVKMIPTRFARHEQV